MGFDLSYYVVVPLLTAVAILALTLYTLKRSMRKDLARRFALWGSSLFIIGLSDAMRKYYAAIGDTEATLFWIKVLALGGIVFIPTFVEFSLHFPPRIEPWSTRVSLLSLTISLLFIPILPTDLLVEGLIKTPIGYSAKAGPLIYVFGPVFVAFVIYAFFNLYTKVSIRSKRYRFSLYVLGLFIVLGSLITFSPPIQEAIYEPPVIGLLAAATVTLLAQLVLKEGFIVIPPIPIYDDRILELEVPTGVFLVKRDRRSSETLKQLLSYHASRGNTVLYITGEEAPSKANYPVLVLSQDLSKLNTVHPKDLTSVEYYVKAFMDGKRRSIIVIDGIERLYAENKSERVRNLLERVSGAVRGSRRATVMFSLCEESIDENELVYLREKFRQLDLPLY